MSAPIKDPLEFLRLFCKATGLRLYDLQERACVIIRSPAYYGQEGSVIIEWEGSPPRFSIYYGSGLIASGKKIEGEPALEACNLVESFLKAHPANADGSPVWVGTRWRDRP